MTSQADIQSPVPGGSDNPVSAVVDHIKRRLDSPFFGPFFLAWVVVNWKFLATLFMDTAPIEDRISDALSLHGGHFFWLPLGIALAYILGSPILNAAARVPGRFGDLVDGRLLLFNLGHEEAQALKIAEQRRKIWVARQPVEYRGNADAVSRREDQVSRREREMSRSEAANQARHSELDQRENQLHALTKEAREELVIRNSDDVAKIKAGIQMMIQQHYDGIASEHRTSDRLRALVLDDQFAANLANSLRDRH